MKKITCLTLLFVAPLAIADDKITVEPKAPTLERGAVVILVAKTEGKSVKWIPKDDGLNLLTQFAADGKTVVVNAPANARGGLYRLLAVTAIGDQPEIVEIAVLVNSPEPPPGPGPGPGPAPGPVVDDLPKRLKAAYDTDPQPQAFKRGQAIELLAIYSQMVPALDEKAANPIATSRQLLGILKNVAEAAKREGRLVDNILRDMRTIIADETTREIGPPNDLPLDRAKATAYFRRLTAALGPLTK